MGESEEAAAAIAYNDINNRNTTNWIACYVVVSLIPFVFLGCAMYANWKAKCEKRAARARLAARFAAAGTANRNARAKHPPPPPPEAHLAPPQEGGLKRKPSTRVADRVAAMMASTEEQYEMDELADRDHHSHSHSHSRKASNNFYYKSSYHSRTDSKDKEMAVPPTTNNYWDDKFDVGLDEEDEDEMADDLESGRRGQSSKRTSSSSATLRNSGGPSTEWWDKSQRKDGDNQF